MQECPRCGGTAEADPEHPNARWCLSCWHAWTYPQEPSCGGSLPRLASGLRVLRESRHLNR
ncbi:hypothetical protein ACFWPV_22855 [Streptomyces uncialis]|uniref:hypothetical protein n=1 Tax=Streptomyces uncialis TaxID=1048205 RepID=UPI0009402878